MWRLMQVSFFFSLFLFGCSSETTPKRLSLYLPAPSVAVQAPGHGSVFSRVPIQAVLVILNDTGFQRSAPGLRTGTLQHLGERLKGELETQLPLQISSVIYPEPIALNGSAPSFSAMAKEQGVPYILVAVLSSSEVEVFERLPLQGTQQGGGLRSMGLPGYRAENYARMELAMVDGQTGQAVVTTDGQAWAVLERLEVPLASNVYPVVRRGQTQPPIYPNNEEDAYETLRWVSGQDALAQAVMHLEAVWRKGRAAPGEAARG